MTGCPKARTWGWRIQSKVKETKPKEIGQRTDYEKNETPVKRDGVRGKTRPANNAGSGATR